MVFELRFVAYGDKPSNVVARGTGFNGRDMDALPTSIYHGPEPLIPTQKNASRHVPEAGAVCGSSARTDLCGGWQVTAIPTATDLVTFTHTECPNPAGGAVRSWPRFPPPRQASSCLWPSTAGALGGSSPHTLQATAGRSVFASLYHRGCVAQ